MLVFLPLTYFQLGFYEFQVHPPPLAAHLISRLINK
jgi:hypothetical protein